MRGLDPRIHVFLAATKDVDGRVKPGHDEKRQRSCAAAYLSLSTVFTAAISVARSSAPIVSAGVR
jgi:hypothetical protein